jgi:serine/threonine protein kinase
MNLVSNKINYVGEYTLGKYLEKKLLEGTDVKKQSEIYIRRLVNTHMYLLDSLVMLNEYNVIHLDLKGNNIMIDKSKNKPVIIDFGMSYDKSLLNMNNYKEKATNPFGIAEKYYIPWCVEVIILSHIARYLMDHQTKKIIDENKERKIIDEKNIGILQTIVSDYMRENTILKMSVFTNEERETYNKKIMDWINSMIGKTWNEIWTMVSGTCSSWDNYSVSVMYLMELNIVGLLKSTNNDFLNQYILELKKTIISSPKERDTPKKTGDSLKPIFSKISKKHHTERVAFLSNIVDNNTNKEKMIKIRTVQENDSVQKEQYIRNKN